MTMMRSPEGDEREIADAGVTALSRLGWEVVEEKKPAQKRAAKKPDKADEK